MGVQENWAKIIGIILILVGVVGFFVGDNLLGFDINSAHNVVHIITGIIFAWAGFAGSGAKVVNTWLGVIYVVVGIVGFFNVLGFLNVNVADNWLHLIIGVVSAGIGWKA